MMLLYGLPVRDKIANRLIGEIKKMGKRPMLAIIQVGNDTRSTSYIKQKKIFGEKIGVLVRVLNFPESATRAQIISKVKNLNSNKEINGVIVQIPLPGNLEKQEIIDAIDPLKDVDGLTTVNQKFLLAGKPRVISATARGILELLKYYQIKIAGQKVAVMGRSSLVGGPTAKLLALKGAEVKVIHTQTGNPKEISKWADILVVAIGNAELVDSSYIKRGVVVVDVGVNLISGKRLEEELSSRKLVGDVNFNSVAGLVSAISPVPGGVGPMTVVALFENLLDARRVQNLRSRV